MSHKVYNFDNDLINLLCHGKEVFYQLRCNENKKCPSIDSSMPNKLPPNLLDDVKSLNRKGVKKFRMRDYFDAAHIFLKALIHLVTSLPFQRDDDENVKICKNEQIKILTNLVVTSNIVGASVLVRDACNLTRKLTGNKLSCQMLFHESRALANLGKKRLAYASILAAEKLQPDNKRIKIEIWKLEKQLIEDSKEKIHLTTEKQQFALMKKARKMYDKCEKKILDMLQSMDMPTIENTLNECQLTDDEVKKIVELAYRLGYNIREEIV